MPASMHMDFTQPTPRGSAPREVRPDADSNPVDGPSSFPLTEAALAAIRTKET